MIYQTNQNQNKTKIRRRRAAQGGKTASTLFFREISQCRSFSAHGPLEMVPPSLHPTAASPSTSRCDTKPTALLHDMCLLVLATCVHHEISIGGIYRALDKRGVRRSRRQANIKLDRLSRNCSLAI